MNAGPVLKVVLYYGIAVYLSLIHIFHCGTCLRLARQGGVFEENGEIRLNRDVNDDWDAIIDACPSGAIVMDSRTYEPEELVEELLKDAVFFRNGGGVTLSGGEPLGQPEFAIKVLKLLHGAGLHTAIETDVYKRQVLTNVKMRWTMSSII